jgi:hypothetical protein
MVTFEKLPGTRVIKEFPYCNWLKFNNRSIKVLKKYLLDDYPGPAVLFFDAEVVSPNGKLLLSDDNKYIIEQASRRSAEVAHSGKYSIKIDNQNTQAIACDLLNVKVNDFIGATLWYYSGSSPDNPVMIFNCNGYSRKIRPKILQAENSWKLLSYSFYSPGSSTVSISFDCKGLADTYVDDLKIFKEAIK